MLTLSKGPPLGALWGRGCVTRAADFLFEELCTRAASITVLRGSNRQQTDSRSGAGVCAECAG